MISAGFTANEYTATEREGVMTVGIELNMPSPQEIILLLDITPNTAEGNMLHKQVLMFYHLKTQHCISTVCMLLKMVFRKYCGKDLSLRTLSYTYTSKIEVKSHFILHNALAIKLFDCGIKLYYARIITTILQIKLLLHTSPPV